MKRLITLLATLLCLCCMTAQAQVKYLVNSYAPVASHAYKAYKYNGTASPKIDMSGGLKWVGGFTVGHTTLPYNPGYATFKLGGKYDKLMFVLGYNNNGVFKGTGIFTVIADGRKILDKRVYPYSTPERIILDINGVNELKFQLADGDADIAVAEATLWTKGQTPKETGNMITGKAKTIELVKDLPSYYENAYLCPVSPKYKTKSLKINNVEYSYGLHAYMHMALIGNNPGCTYFNLRGQYDKLSFIVGPLDDDDGHRGKGWFTVKADDKIIWEYEMNYDDIARQVTLDVSGCQMLSFHSEQSERSTDGGIVRIMAYPPGVQPNTAGDAAAPVNPRLKTLPDVCKLISNIRPYAAGAQVKKQIYDGSSEYITFSMGGVKFSEGFMLYQKANIMSDDLTSYAVFDLGREFDYVSFTAGYIGKSGALNDDVLRVIADDEVVLEAPLRATWPNQNYVVPIHKCRRLRFENNGSGKLDVAAFGVTDLVVYRGEPVANTLFEHPKPVCPPQIDLLDLGAPYIHYVSPMKDCMIYYDGSTQRNYFTVGDRRINKGFLLQTSVHFSLDYGPLSSGSANAAAGAIGSAAVGSSFVAGTTAIGGVTVGSTLAGVAAFLMLAAGGEAVENSCAAFNTYGEYNSVTFTVACVKPHNESRPSAYNETLLIGADHRVVAELSINEQMEPQTVTVPIDGCNQLMFWIANTDNWSGVYGFYDIKLSKSKTTLNIPRAARYSGINISRPRWGDYAFENKWERPESSGGKTLNEFFVKLSNTYLDIKDMMKSNPNYKIHTCYLETEAGQVCKAVQLKDSRDKRNYLSFISEFNSAKRNLEKMFRIKQDLSKLTSMKTSAAFDIPWFGSGSRSSSELFKKAKLTLAECKQLVNAMIEDHKYNAAYLKALIDTSVDIDGKQSTERTIICPLFKGEKAPEGYLQTVGRFNMK